MKKLFIFFLIFVLLIIFEQFFLTNFLPANEKNYLYGYKNYFNRLEETSNKERIILLGGSSLALGVSAERITKVIGIETINGGIHAGIGYEGIYDLSRDYISKDNDLIVISPEYELLKNSNKSNDTFCYVKNKVLRTGDLNCIGHLIASWFRFRFIPSGAANEKNYISSGFNEYGDYVLRRNTVEKKINKIIPNQICSNLPNLNEINKYINYFDDLKKKGFKILYIPNVIPNTACTDILKLKYVTSRLNNKFGLDNDFDHLFFLPEKYFSDTTYHLTKKGTEIKTDFFIEVLKIYLKKS